MNLAKRQNFILTVTTTAYDYSYDGYDNGGPSAMLRQCNKRQMPSPPIHLHLIETLNFFSFSSFLHDNILFLETFP